ncbi:monovalent cation/H+ antiporter subunit D family protein [Nannocystis punicea]|uniref:Monovalent cation/H+ antiporter subunit D family protein n=1 Tax=Nannocystis punicea TaxID=2995304 RepID=A0ABY7HE43_9BACT|nr:monovalent cation/H+ antiporter subunit D family protein [Nannocystis poenicansa]WAS97537.1 monovalent cation/H+ antiporter subunit D family protein [Nannocystis poenicansa]
MIHLDVSPPLLAVYIPLLGALLISLAGRWPNLRELVTLLTAGTLLWVVAGIAPTVLADDFWASFARAPAIKIAEVLPGIWLELKVEPLGMLFALIASSLWILNSIYSIGYMRGNHEKNQTRFYVCFALAIASVMGLAFAGNLFTLFVFYEALTLTTYPLVAHKGSAEAIRSARTYLGILVVTSVCFLLAGIIGTYVFTGGDMTFRPGGVFKRALADGSLTAPTLGILFVLYMYGIGKAALMPVHRWLPAAMVAPTPVSALLHAVAVVKAGVFTVLKVIVYVFGPAVLVRYGAGEWLIYIAGATILIASCIALFQDNLKRRLAYSTVSQLSYVIIAAALLSPLSITAAALHIAAHAFGKITLFFAAGSIYTAAHKTEISQLDGIGRRMPITMAAFTIGSLSMIGLPPTAGFVSKWYLLQATWETDAPFVLIVVILSTLLNAAYFLPIVYRAFFVAEAKHHREPHQSSADGDFGDHADHHGHDAHDHGEAPWPIVVALSCTAAATIAFFFYSDLAIGLATQLRSGLP